MREWIVTNGLGGYASLSYKLTNTRKYHGLLIASLDPPTQRWVFVSNVHDFFRIGSQLYDLHNYRGRFVFDIFPSFVYDIDGILHLKKTFFMQHEKNTTLIRYRIIPKKPVTMLHHPVVNSRHLYDTTKQRSLSLHHQIDEQRISVQPDNTDRWISIEVDGFTYHPDFYWEVFYYDQDRIRNDAWIDNAMHLGDFSKLITEPSTYYLVLSIEPEPIQNPESVFQEELKRKKSLIQQSYLADRFTPLVLAADQFLVKKGEGKSIIAGYHWFSDWGRDTLIALPGITLIPRRFFEAKEILLNFGKFCRNGLIPNTFMDRDSQPVYNTVDASLWFIDRVYQYLKYTNDVSILQSLWRTMDSIIEHYCRGTDFGICMHDDFLIGHNPGLTWMDVKIGDYYPTPRSRKAVEIQALWYNALRIMSMFALVLKKPDHYSEKADQVKLNFLQSYDQIYDVIDTKDTSLRPNCVFLVSLDFSMVDQQLAQRIVSLVQEKLLTVFGLRTLSPDDSRYLGNYLGSYNKDLAYHNGTVWPWLLGPFITAYIKINHRSHQARLQAYHEFLEPMLDIFGENWDGTIYEIFDGNSPFLPQGCISQAWSVAEILRAWVEDIENKQPPYAEAYMK
ncbi:MAG: amylo-alpha-1,6-glucosidase [Candidatus Thermoplasmatota archaeon]